VNEQHEQALMRTDEEDQQPQSQPQQQPAAAGPIAPMGAASAQKQLQPQNQQPLRPRSSLENAKMGPAERTSTATIFGEFSTSAQLEPSSQWEWDGEEHAWIQDAQRRLTQQQWQSQRQSRQASRKFMAIF
jgi:hypothetical protein